MNKIHNIFCSFFFSLNKYKQDIFLKHTESYLNTHYIKYWFLFNIEDEHGGAWCTLKDVSYQYLAI